VLEVRFFSARLKTKLTQKVARALEAAAHGQAALLGLSLAVTVLLAAGMPRAARAWTVLPFAAHALSFLIARGRRGASTSPSRQAFESQLGVIKAIALAVEARDRYTQGHCLRVRYLVRRILDALGTDPGARHIIEAAALLHDVGKVGVPDAILLKDGPLTPKERTRLMLHVEIGVEVLKPLPALSTALILVKHHHERFDGTGYPDGLKGEEIPFGSRVIAVADTLDAMRSTRPYRKAMSLEKAIEEIERSSGRQLDPKIVEAAVSVLRAKDSSGGPATPPELEQVPAENEAERVLVAVAVEAGQE
jgi:HD-GYP domain-containing protein (c-di-GMP phosphodiesterase class II)